MNASPTTQTEPILKRIDGPPKPPTKTTLDLMDNGGPPPEDNPIQEMMMAYSNASTTHLELLMLQGGGRYEKREGLELSLDRNVVLLGKFMPKMHDELLQLVQSKLRDIRDYRRRFPGKDASNKDQAAQAQRILDGITEV